jgi:hypothetical protein
MGVNVFVQTNTKGGCVQLVTDKLSFLAGEWRINTKQPPTPFSWSYKTGFAIAYRKKWKGK